MPTLLENHSLEVKVVQVAFRGPHPKPSFYETFIVAHVDDTDEHLAQALVYNAGRLAWRMRESGLTTEQKSETNISDVVTAADRAAEKFIADALATIRPEDGVLGEEGTQR